MAGQGCSPLPARPFFTTRKGWNGGMGEFQSSQQNMQFYPKCQVSDDVSPSGTTNGVPRGSADAIILTVAGDWLQQDFNITVTWRVNSEYHESMKRCGRVMNTTNLTQPHTLPILDEGRTRHVRSTTLNCELCCANCHCWPGSFPPICCLPLSSHDELEAPIVGNQGRDDGRFPRNGKFHEQLPTSATRTTRPLGYCNYWDKKLYTTLQVRHENCDTVLVCHQRHPLQATAR
ncbi:uncharacterized protein B0H64DRAFT_32197 [Chaetomium fimeti]|uniref:Uncharacterized protein n=1 Tax=Chaetomium fimeti TaxID=1854472 RepID=A0AAE0HR75_9PEZI|nr:hypothetical protein B0H64DRAFT_32197 [Chaetomium fimeti]